jgi:FlaA1/EpsC-like NDP-sugar epimerase
MKLRPAYFVKSATALADMVLIAVAMYGAYSIRFDFGLDSFYRAQMFSMLPIVVLVRFSALYYSLSYQFLWRYAGISDLVRIIKATIAGLVVLAVINYFRNYPLGLLIAAGFFISALFHRGFLHFLPRIGHKQLLIGGAAGASLVVLGVGLLAFSILSSAPVHLDEIPFGEHVVPYEFPRDKGMPRGVLVMESILSFILLSGVRIAPRLIGELVSRGRQEGRRTLIFGAGDLGETILRGMKKDPGLGHGPVGFIDDDPEKQRSSIHGVGVLGTREDLSYLIDSEKVDEVLIAVPSLSDDDLRQIAAACWQKRVSVRRVPSLASMMDPEAGLRNLEDVDIEELLGRPEIQLDPEHVRDYLEDHVVLVTGAGGSIGSELCRQISRCQPAKLILLGKGENSLYAIQSELARRYPGLNQVSVIADIASPTKMAYVFRCHYPDVVFHAAAHKHVPFMEENPEEAVLNNIFGTRNVAETAARHDCSRFVMVSSDKAVNPTSVMGTTKRIAEMTLQGMASAGETKFVTVRFGNVLRSRGSVIPLFEKQIAAGGPVTVTHPEMKRYFMSIPEAVRLVLHSGAIGANGDLHILDMGEQVRIVDLAENMIRMTGKVPYDEIDIQFTGIRPGEKLYEELFTDEEARTLRKIDKIFVSRPDRDGSGRLAEMLPALREAALSCQRDRIIEVLEQIVPSFESALLEPPVVVGGGINPGEGRQTEPGPSTIGS